MAYIEAKKDLEVYALYDLKLKPLLTYLVKQGSVKKYQTIVKGSGYSKALIEKYVDNDGGKWLIMEPINTSPVTHPVIKYTSDNDFKTSGTSLGTTEKEQVKEEEKKDFFNAANMRSLIIWIVIILSIVALGAFAIEKKL